MDARIGLIAGSVSGIAVIGGLLYFAFAPIEEATRSSESNRSDRTEDSGRTAKKRKLLVETRPPVRKSFGAGDAAQEQRPRMQMPEDWFANLPSDKDRAIAKRIQDAQDADDCEAVLNAAEEALQSRNDEVRSAAVDALSMQGTAAIPQLLQFVGDANEDVADSAYRAWDDAVDSVESDKDRANAVRDALPKLKSEEHVQSAVGKMESLDKPHAVRELAKLARGNDAVAKAARESYENVTGEPFRSWATAELKAIQIERDNATPFEEE